MIKSLKGFLFVLILLAFSACSAAPQRVIVPDNPVLSRTVTVSGNAEIMVVPDEVLLTLGVETWNTDLDQAKAQNDQIVKQVLGIASDFGIEPKYVQTDYINIQPRYDDYAQRNFLGYFVRKTVEVTLKDVTRFEDFLSQVLKVGVNYVQGIEFRTTELRKHRDEARSLAIKAAREKAQALAGELGQNVGLPISIHEEYNNWWSPYNSWWGASGQAMSQNVVQNAGGAPPESEGGIAVGQISVSASVSVEFELR